MAEPTRKKVTTALPTKLTNEELLRYGRALAQTEADLRELEEKHDQVKAGMKAELSEITGRRSMLANLVASEEEMRDVECEDVFDHLHARVTRVRLDTGEVIRERPMTAEERQRSFLGDL